MVSQIHSRILENARWALEGRARAGAAAVRDKSIEIECGRLTLHSTLEEAQFSDGRLDQPMTAGTLSRKRKEVKISIFQTKTRDDADGEVDYPPPGILLLFAIWRLELGL